MWTGKPVIYEIGAAGTLADRHHGDDLAILITLPLGTLAIFQNTIVDHVIRVISIAGLAIPPSGSGWSSSCCC